MTISGNGHKYQIAPLLWEVKLLLRLRQLMDTDVSLVVLDIRKKELRVAGKNETLAGGDGAEVVELEPAS